MEVIHKHNKATTSANLVFLDRDRFAQQSEIAAGDSGLKLTKKKTSIQDIDQRNVHRHDVFTYVDVHSLGTAYELLAKTEERQIIFDAAKAISSMCERYNTLSDPVYQHFAGLSDWVFDACFKLCIYAVSYMQQEGKFLDIECAAVLNPSQERFFELRELHEDGEIIQIQTIIFER